VLVLLTLPYGEYGVGSAYLEGADETQCDVRNGRAALAHCAATDARPTSFRWVRVVTVIWHPEIVFRQKSVRVIRNLYPGLPLIDRCVVPRMSRIDIPHRLVLAQPGL